MDTFVDSLSTTDLLLSTETLSQSSACFSQDLYATFWQDSAHSTIQSILSSLRQTNASLSAARAEIPTNPYERLKWEHCHRDAEPFNLDDVEVPEDFSFEEAHKEILKISRNHSNNFANHLEILKTPNFDLTEHPNFGNAFAIYNEGEFKIDKDKATDHFAFIDMIRSVPLEYIVANPTEFAQKVVTKYIEINR